jgi:hypothetical protein
MSLLNLAQAFVVGAAYYMANSGGANAAQPVETEACKRCGRMNHNVGDCYALTTYNGYVLPCARCGYPSHVADECYAKRHKDGTVLVARHRNLVWRREKATPIERKAPDFSEFAYDEPNMIIKYSPVLSAFFAEKRARGFGWVYVQQLKGGYWYVGYTERQSDERFEEHARGEGSKWTQLHPVISVVGKRRGTPDDEKELTVRLMHEVGWHKVRGGRYCKVEMQYEPDEVIALRTAEEARASTGRVDRSDEFAYAAAAAGSAR